MKGRKRPFVEGQDSPKPKTEDRDIEPEIVDTDDVEPELDEADPAALGVDDEEAEGGKVIDVLVDGDAEIAAEPTEVGEEGLRPPRRGPGLTRTDPLSSYMAQIRKIPLLSREEEGELARKYYETGDMDLARRLVTANLRLVVKIAHEYRRAHRNLLDLIQEGNMGLLQAMKKYDPYRGVKLSSYAAWWIRAYILKFILNNWRLVKIGTTQAQRKLFFNLRKEKEKLEQLGFESDHKLLAERLDVTEAEVSEMEKRLEAPDMSLDVPLARDDAGGVTRLDVLPSSSETRPDVRVEASEFRGILREKLDVFAGTLEGRDATLFRDRWLTETPATLQEIGDRFSISRERARQLEKRLLDKLRVYLEAELGTAVDIGSLAAEE